MMMNIKLRLLALAAALVTLLTLGAEAEGFSFRGGVTWDATMDEVMALEEENAPSLEDEYIPGFPKLVEIRNAKVAGMTASSLAYLFREGLLIAFLYDFSAHTEADFQTLKTALTAKYGEPSASDPQAAAARLNAIAGQEFVKPEDLKGYAQWGIDGVTNIFITYIQPDNFTIFYENRQRMDAFIHRETDDVNTDGL